MLRKENPLAGQKAFRIQKKIGARAEVGLKRCCMTSDGIHVGYRGNHPPD
jgi:hypothetical protein